MISAYKKEFISINLAMVNLGAVLIIPLIKTSTYPARTIS